MTRPNTQTFTTHYAALGQQRIQLSGHALYRGSVVACIDWIEAHAGYVVALSMDHTWRAMYPDAPEFQPDQVMGSLAHDLAVNIRPVVARSRFRYQACVTAPLAIWPEDTITVNYEHPQGFLCVKRLSRRYQIEALDPNAAVATVLCRGYV